MTTSGPASLLIALAKGDRGRATEILDATAFGAADLGEFLRRNLLGGFLLSHLGNLVDHRFFTDELREQLERHRRWLVRAAERTRDDVAELVGLLEEDECRVVLLKGLYLAERFYRGLDQRGSWDIDLLIRDADFPRAQQALRRAGFRRLSRTLLGESLSRRFVHGFDFERERCKLDLHWAVVAHPAVRIDSEALWNSIRPTEVAGIQVHVLPDDLMLASHLVSALEDLQRGSLRLRSLLDIYKILQQLESTTDWPRFFADRDEQGLRRISHGMLSLFLDVFDASDEFPVLAAAMSAESAAGEEEGSRPANPLASSVLGLRHKRWAAAQYEMSRTRLFVWWLASLPFRITVYQSDKLGRRLRSLVGRPFSRGVAT
jgi:hypothetical protein